MTHIKLVIMSHYYWMMTVITWWVVPDVWVGSGLSFSYPLKQSFSSIHLGASILGQGWADVPGVGWAWCSYLHINPVTPFCWPNQNPCPIYQSKHQNQKYFKFHSLIFFENFSQIISSKIFILISISKFFSSLKKIFFCHYFFPLGKKRLLRQYWWGLIIGQ